jgi:predicted dehydrogenase
MIGIGVIGYGYWGPNLVRNFAELPGSQVVSVCDLNAERLGLAKRRYPAIETTQNYQDLLNNPFVDAIVIASPVSSHFKLALAALENGKHVLLEKPLTQTTQEAKQLIELARSSKLVLMVDHTFVYTGAVRKMKALLNADELGELYYYDSVRVNLGLFQHDVNVIWDLAVHDLSIIDFLLDQKPVAVSATGIKHIDNQPEDIAYITLFFEGNLIAHIHVNWLAPVKVRRTLLGGSRKMIVYDDLEPSEKVKVYDRGINLVRDSQDVYEMLINYRTGDMWAPKIELVEALYEEAQHFLDCIRGTSRPITGAAAGLRVVQIMEAATLSMAERGRSVELDLDSL